MARFFKPQCMYRLTSNWTNKITKVVVVQYSWHYNVEFGHRFSPALCRHSLMVRHCGRPYSSRLLTINSNQWADICLSWLAEGERGQISHWVLKQLQTRTSPDLDKGCTVQLTSSAASIIWYKLSQISWYFAVPMRGIYQISERCVKFCDAKSLIDSSDEQQNKVNDSSILTALRRPSALFSWAVFISAMKKFMTASYSTVPCLVST